MSILLRRDILTNLIPSRTMNITHEGTDIIGYYCMCIYIYFVLNKYYYIITRQVTRATHVRTRVCPRVELILKIIIILLIIFLGFIKSKPC